MFNLAKWLNYEPPQPILPKPTLPKPTNVGEPVLAIIKAMETVTDWTLKSKWYNLGLKSDVITHRATNLTLTFDLSSDWVYDRDKVIVESIATWATTEENELLAEAYLKFKDEYIKIQKEYEVIEHYLTRQKYMAFVKEVK